MNLGAITEQKLKEILVQAGYVSREDMADAEKNAADQGIGIVFSLTQKNYINKALIGQAIAEFYKYPYANLDADPPKKELVELIPEEMARKYRIIISDTQGNKAVVATDNPGAKDLAVQLEKIFFDLFLESQQLEVVTGKKPAVAIPERPQISIAYALPDNIDNAFIFYRKGISEGISEIVRGKESVALGVIDEIIEDALLRRSSDIHIEPRSENIRLRFRIDGALVEAGEVPVKYYEQLINGIKLAANLRIDEHSAIQDGAIRWESKEANSKQSVDLRISIAPTIYGEAITIRLLSRYISTFSLDKIGLRESDEATMREEIKKPFGMIMVVGPTGSGKTTTLYTLVQILNKPDRKIITIEDPVEYRVENIHQIQINPQADITFSKALKSIVRQDPDIILVGEIRDEETASLATNISLTGHLLLSTFHANDASSGITRLMQMGVEPFLIASTLEVVISQRLARTICPTCKYSKSFSLEEVSAEYPAIAPYLPKDKKEINLYQGKGCGACNRTGYLGRTALFEIIRMLPEMRALVLGRPSTDEVWDLARREGAVSLFEDGFAKVKLGITTLSELMRVAKPPVK